MAISNSFDIGFVYSQFSEVARIKATTKEQREEMDSHVMSAYGEIIAEMMQNLTKTGVSKPFLVALKSFLHEELAGVGVKESKVKRLVENSVGAVRLFRGDLPTQATGEAVVALLTQEGITSENKLAKAVSGENEKSAAQILAEKVVGKWSSKKDKNGQKVQGDVFKEGLSYDDIEEFQKIFESLMAERKEFETNVKDVADSAKVEGAKVSAMIDDVNQAASALSS